MKKTKINVTLGDLQELFFITEMNVFMDFKDFVDGYKEDPEFKVIDSWIVTIYDAEDDEEDEIDKRLKEENL